jgi:hypothetical protein
MENNGGMNIELRILTQGIRQRWVASSTSRRLPAYERATVHIYFVVLLSQEPFWIWWGRKYVYHCQESKPDPSVLNESLYWRIYSLSG